jgi:hypothetical protein
MDTRPSVDLQHTLRARSWRSRLPRALLWIALCGPVLATDLTELRKPAPDPKVQTFRQRVMALVPHCVWLSTDSLLHNPRIGNGISGHVE